MDNQVFIELFGQSPEAILIQDLDGSILECNKAASKILGYKRKELLGLKIGELMLAEALKDFPKLSKEILRKRKIFLEALGKKKNGVLIPVEIDFKLVKTKDKNFVLALARDISHHKKIETELLRQKNKFFEYFQVSGVMIIVLDHRGIVLEINKAGCDVLGYKEKDIIGKEWFKNFLPVRFRKSTKEVFKKIISGEIKSVEFFENPILDSKGGEHLISWHNTFLKDEKGKNYAILSSGDDITEAQEIKKLLQESEIKFKHIFNSINDAVVIHNLKGEILEVNEVFLKRLGYSKKEFINLSPEKVDSSEFTDKIPKRISEVLKKGFLVFESVHVTKKSKRIPVEVNARLIDFVGQKAIISICRDVTERQNIEKILRESEKKYRGLFETSRDAIMTIDPPSWNFTSANLVTLKTFGVKNEKDFLTYPPWRLSPKLQPDGSDSKKKAKEMIDLAMKKGSNLFAWTHKRISGQDFLAEVFLSRVKLEEKTFLQAIVRDVTDKNKIEKTLKESEEKYSNLVEKSNDGIVLIQDGKVSFLNKKMSEMLGYTVKEGLNKNFLDFIAPEDKKRVYENNVGRLQGKKVENRYEFILFDKNKNKVPVEATVSLVDFGDKKGVMAIIRDMTKSKEIEKIKSEFISVTSHQMRTPLTGTKWFTELLLAGKAGEVSGKQKDYLQQVQVSNERMINLVDDLLNVSRMESSEKFKVVLKPNDVVQIFHQVIDTQKIIADKKNVKIVHDGKCLKNFVINSDRDKFYLVLQNILDNAVKYSPNNSTVTVGCDLKNDDLVFSVTDYGIGIPKKQQHRMFERFFRADNVISTQPGTGLGLYIAKFILDKHGGKIWFESEENKGSTFYVSLPINNSKKLTSIIK